MNQHQRKFLLEQIEKQYKVELQALRDRRPKEPALNNYLVAAILDGSAKLRPAEELRYQLVRRVRDLGKGEALVEGASRWAGPEEVDVLRLPARLLFEEPPAYTEQREKYEAALAQWKDEASQLDTAFNAMRLKVQVGSDKALESLVDQADKLCSMSLTSSSRLFLPSHT